jgi:hypothetical protein
MTRPPPLEMRASDVVSRSTWSACTTSRPSDPPHATLRPKPDRLRVRMTGWRHRYARPSLISTRSRRRGRVASGSPRGRVEPAESAADPERHRQDGPGGERAEGHGHGQREEQEGAAQVGADHHGLAAPPVRGRAGEQPEQQVRRRLEADDRGGQPGRGGLLVRQQWQRHRAGGGAGDRRRSGQVPEPEVPVGQQLRSRRDGHRHRFHRLSPAPVPLRGGAAQARQSW